jgi:hypothetical protein
MSAFAGNHEATINFNAARNAVPLAVRSAVEASNWVEQLV